jgi:Reverse transcriptase (RNA-dependent DNA polymerase)
MSFFKKFFEEQVYMIIPPGHKEEININLIYRLKKLIYGLKQSLRAWYEKLSSYLISCGFMASKTDLSLFINLDKHNIVIILVYVDDIIITDNNLDKIRGVKK